MTAGTGSNIGSSDWTAGGGHRVTRHQVIWLDSEHRVIWQGSGLRVNRHDSGHRVIRYRIVWLDSGHRVTRQAAGTDSGHWYDRGHWVSHQASGHQARQWAPGHQALDRLARQRGHRVTRYDSGL
ncbi:unnamed protein product [Staurois parvus]|uniref:Uncharacterized protein n=1 Tax=Staurois parvus TaxID=386267 RepID=A0ABN9B5F9_9NEOB|nr:unnamed protein product [Staurois parvus]